MNFFLLSKISNYSLKPKKFVIEDSSPSTQEKENVFQQHEKRKKKKKEIEVTLDMEKGII